MAIRYKLTFLSIITRILHHFSVSFPVSDHFHVMCAIDAVTIKRSEARFRSRRSRSAAPPTPSTPSTFAPSTSIEGVTLDAIMAQFQRMDAHLDTLTTEMYQVNNHADRIARRQAHLGGFVESPSPPPKAFEDDDASSSSIDKMST